MLHAKTIVLMPNMRRPNWRMYILVHSSFMFAWFIALSYLFIQAFIGALGG